MAALRLNMESSTHQPFSKADKKSVTVLTTHKVQKLSLIIRLLANYRFLSQFGAKANDSENSGRKPFGKNINSFKRKKKRVQNSSICDCIPLSNTDAPICFNFRHTD